MKKLVKVEEVSGEGLVGLMGEEVTLFCLNYIYAGKLVGVNDAYVKLEGAKVVYATGDFKEKSWADAQPLPFDWYIVTSSVESFGKLKG